MKQKQDSRLEIKISTGLKGRAAKCWPRKNKGWVIPVTTTNHLECWGIPMVSAK